MRCQCAGDVGLVVLPQHVEGADDRGLPAPRQRHLEAAECESDTGNRRGSAPCHALRLDLDPDHLDIRASRGQPPMQLECRGGGGTEAQIDHERMLRAAQCRELLNPPIHPAEPVRAGGSTRDGTDGHAPKSTAPAVPAGFLPANGRALNLRHDTHSRTPAPRELRMEPEEPLHRMGRRAPQRAGRRRSEACRRAARLLGPPPRRAAHLGAEARHPDREHRARGRRPRLDRRATLLAPQRAPLRRAAGQGQGPDPRGVRPGAVPDLASLLRRAAAAARRRQRVLAGARPPLRRAR